MQVRDSRPVKENASTLPLPHVPPQFSVIGDFTVMDKFYATVFEQYKIASA